MAEKCDNLDGINLIHSISGGTGSGAGGHILERCSEEYSKKMKFTFTVHPSMKAADKGTILSHYNTCLASHSLIEHTDLTVYFQNQALYEICQKNLRVE